MIVVIIQMSFPLEDWVSYLISFKASFLVSVGQYVRCLQPKILYGV